MRYMFLGILMTAVVFGLITWTVRPDLLERQYERVAAPIENHLTEKRAAAWQAAKDQAWQRWLARAHLPGNCRQPATALHELECRNEIQLQQNSFERDWAARVASGWHPEGTN